MRIVSVVPSQTELLYFLGITPVAQTLFCVRPKANFKTSVKIGGTKKLNIEKIRSLQPDLILANKEENEKWQIETLQKEFNVYISDIHTFDDALNMIHEVGQLTGTTERANQLVHDILTNFNTINPRTDYLPRILYLIWKEPYMVVARNTFIHSMIQKAGFLNAVPEEWIRYPEITLEQIKGINPDCIFLSSEPYPFKESHVAELKEQLPRSLIKIVDGELFSWYGNRMLDAAQYFRNLNEEVRRDLSPT